MDMFSRQGDNTADGFMAEMWGSATKEKSVLERF
jgi:hypothetical protein